MSLNIKNGDELIPVAGTPKVTRSSLELENVDNTADLDKPVSTATQAALDLKADITDLDKKANKTFIEVVDNTTSVVTVPENVAGFAAISKICGKTRKTVNLFDINGINDALYNGTTDTYKNTIENNTLSPSTLATQRHGGGQWIPTVVGKSYTVSFKNIGTKRGTCAIYHTENSTERYFKIVNDNESTTFTFEAKNSKSLITFQGYDEWGAKFTDIQVQEGTTATPYEPYGELWNAPVKSVVSMGKNIIEATYNNTSVDSTGTIVSSTGYNTHIAKVKAGIKYNINKGSDTSVYAFYTSFPVVGSQSYNSTRVVGDTSSRVIITAPIDGYIAYRTTTTYPNTNINEGETAIAYTPPFKTTVSVPKEILDLPDYGCSITRDDGTTISNEVDFENGIYYHRVKSVELTNLNKGYGSPFSTVDIPSITSNIPNGYYGICNKYTVVRGDAEKLKSESKQINIASSGMTSVIGRCFIYDTSITSLDLLKEELNGAYLIYELATTEVIDLTNILYPFAVESGGTITFENEHNLDVNNTVLYKKEV